MRKRLTLSVPETTFEQLQSLKAQGGISMSRVVVDAVNLVVQLRTNPLSVFSFLRVKITPGVVITQEPDGTIVITRLKEENQHAV